MFFKKQQYFRDTKWKWKILQLIINLSLKWLLVMLIGGYGLQRRNDVCFISCVQNREGREKNV